MNSNTILKTLAAAGCAMVLGTALVSCGGSTPSTSTADHNDQDVSFATDMIPHHAQAIVMSEMVKERTSSDEVRQLAEDIAAAQGPEIEQMSGWLESWGEEVPDTSDGDGGMGDMDHGDMSMDGDDMGTDGMGGMMSSEDMAMLGRARGSGFDQMFLTMMIEHHRGAIEMARTEQADGEYADAIDLAKEIESAQLEEIERMEEMLASS